MTEVNRMQNKKGTRHVCWVLQRDIKLDNLFIIRGASKVKLIDFRCGEIMSRSPYKSYSGMH